jgi:hypothetical protein
MKIESVKLLYIIAATALYIGPIEAGTCLEIHSFVNHTQIDSLNRLDTILVKRLHYEYLPDNLTAVLHTHSDTASCLYSLAATIDSSHQGLFIVLHFGTGSAPESETKLVRIEEKSIRQIVDILALKVRLFLQESMLSTLTITSDPVDCALYLNGIKTGKTPATLLLNPGIYFLSIQAEHCHPFSDSIFLTTGQEVEIEATMKFKGTPSVPWFVASGLLTLSAAVVQLIEYRLHQDYLSISRYCESADGETRYVRCGQDDYDRKYFPYRRVHYLKIGVANAALIGWIITGYTCIRNKIVKKKVFEGE